VCIGLTKLTVSIQTVTYRFDFMNGQARVRVGLPCSVLAGSLRFPLTFLTAWKYAIGLNPAGLNPMRSSYDERRRGRVSVFLERELNFSVRTTLV
jgi:hypothetical protein